MLMLIENVEKPKLPKLVWALRKQFGPETLVVNTNCDFSAVTVGYARLK